MREDFRCIQNLHWTQWEAI